MVVKTLGKRNEDIIAKNYWNPEKVGDVLEGEILDVYDSIYEDQDTGDRKNQGKVMLIEDPDGNNWETKPNVDLREYIPQLEIGQYVVIELIELKEQPNSNYPKKIYSVGVDDEQ